MKWREKHGGNVFLTCAGLILFDFIYTFPIILVAVAIILKEQNAPSHSWCFLLRQEILKSEDVLLPKYTIVTEVLSGSLFHVLPLSAVLILLENKVESGFKWLEKWIPLVKCTAFFLSLDISVRIILFITYISRDKQYPTWVNYPTYMIWFIGIYSVLYIGTELWIQSRITKSLASRLNDEDLDTEKRRAHRALMRKMTLSLFLPTGMGIFFQWLSSSVYYVGNEHDRTMLIIYTSLGMNLVWIYMDLEARSPIPWSANAKTIFEETEEKPENCLESVEDGVERICDSMPTPESKLTDPIERNGFCLSIFIVTAVILTVRVLQANMDTLYSKVITGLIASSLESIIVIIKPQFGKFMRELFRLIKTKRVTPSDAYFDGESQKHKDQVYKWHRSHAIIIVNRLELFAIIFGNILVMLCVAARKRALKQLDETKTDETCNQDMPDYSTIVFETFVLCLVECFVEFFAYMYIVWVENLPLQEIAHKKRLNIAFFLYIMCVILFSVGQLISVGYVVLSCDGYDHIMFDYHCG